MIAISPEGEAIYVTVRDEHALYVISTQDLTVTGTIPTAPDPHGVAYRHAIFPGTVAREARDAEMGWETGGATGHGAPAPGQMPPMGQNMMEQGTCCGMCAMPTTASMQTEPQGMMNMAEEGQMDAKTRGQLLQMRGEMLKAMGDVMMRHGRVLQGAQSQ
jgi:hypothetical protein